MSRVRDTFADPAVRAAMAVPYSKDAFLGSMSADMVPATGFRNAARSRRFTETGRKVLDEESRGWREFLLRGTSNPVSDFQRRSINMLTERRDLSDIVASSGGYTVPASFFDRIVWKQKQFSPIYNLVADGPGLFVTDTGAPLNVPTSDDTGNSAVVLSENEQAIATDFVFGLNTTISSVWVYPQLVRVPRTFLTDAFNTGEGNRQLADPFQSIAEALAVRIARGRANDLVNGLGTTTPNGYAANVGTVGYFGSAGTVAGASALTTAEVYTLFEATDAAYWEAGGVWLCSQGTLQYLAQLPAFTNSTQPLVQFHGNGPEMLGYPIVMDNGLVGTATGQPILCGGAPELGFTIREVNPIEAARLEERYADYLQVGILVHTRLGAGITDPAAASFLVHS